MATCSRASTEHQFTAHVSRTSASAPQHSEQLTHKMMTKGVPTSRHSRWTPLQRPAHHRVTGTSWAGCPHGHLPSPMHQYSSRRGARWPALARLGRSEAPCASPVEDMGSVLARTRSPCASLHSPAPPCASHALPFALSLPVGTKA